MPWVDSPSSIREEGVLHIISTSIDVSPNRVRLQQLQEKLHTQHLTQDDDKQSRREFYEQKIRGIEERMTRSQMGEEGKFKVSIREIIVYVVNEGSDIEVDGRDID